MAAESHSELSDSQAQVAENEKTKRNECQSEVLTEGGLTLTCAIQLSNPTRGLRGEGHTFTKFWKTEPLWKNLRKMLSYLVF